MPDTNHGAGGRYLIDPKTGVRTLVERTLETVSVTLPATADEPMNRVQDDPQDSRPQQPADNDFPSK